MIISEMNDNQRRVMIDTIQLYESFIDVSRKIRSYRGGMHWKKAKGREYLFRSRDRYGYGESLGHRSKETEKIYAEFHKTKQELKSRLRTLTERLQEQARICKAVMIQRVPRVVTGVLRMLDQHQILGRNVTVIGTNVMYAYEAAAGVFFDRALMATKDMDILWDIRPKLTLILADDTKPDGLLGLLKKVDRSFEVSAKRNFRAVNKDGYMVDLLKPESKTVLLKEPRRMGDKKDIEAAEIQNLQWLVSSPKFSQVVIGDDGYPALMIGPDPRSFALHKLWLSEQTDREPLKKKRDHDQGLAVVQLVLQFMPGYRFNSNDFKMFPKNLIEMARERIAASQMPVGMDIEFD